jgi:hypothetical protein
VRKSGDALAMAVDAECSVRLEAERRERAGGAWPAFGLRRQESATRVQLMPIGGKRPLVVAAARRSAGWPCSGSSCGAGQPGGSPPPPVGVPIVVVSLFLLLPDADSVAFGTVRLEMRLQGR